MALTSALRIPKKRFFKELYQEIDNDNVFNGAAALAYYMLFAAFPAMIFLLSLLPYLPIENLHQAIMDFIREALPGQAAQTFEGAVAEITQDKKSGLLSFGAILTLWAASSGLYAIMQQLNITYDVKESRPFWKARGTSIMLTVMFGLLVIGAFALIVFGGVLQDWIAGRFDLGAPLLITFAIFRYLVILALLLAGFALTYYFGPDVEQDFKFISPGSLIGVLVLVVASLGFRFYVDNFGNYDASYGSLGAVIILMLWLYITGLTILLGSEVNALVEHYAPEGKDKGEKAQPENALGHKSWMHGQTATQSPLNDTFRPSTRPIPNAAYGANRSQQAPESMLSKLDIPLAVGALILALKKKGRQV